ncbi:hypothetical protein [Noviherbaspirillum denitrificans]|uniref:Uncharacterized protein n=1 Tax=Noviherbaspirillum denitrificans TaxID=1968433 RepID=A0A254TH20_9BURK|nr:hypothetical protein [Noviherbaspirillum denitrificans]OWW21825.1 hypothetical protein AYR66_22350 [Noviherbaspirillum denitrificans]
MLVDLSPEMLQLVANAQNTQGFMREKLLRIAGDFAEAFPDPNPQPVTVINLARWLCPQAEQPLDS